MGSETNDSDDARSPKTRVRRTKACKACHSLKVRCTPVDESDPYSPCVRCMNSHKVCEMDIDQPRKRRRKTMKKELGLVTELQEQVMELQEQLRQAREKLDAQQTMPVSALASATSVPPSGPSAQAGDPSSPLFIQKLDLEREMLVLCEEDMSLTEILEEIRSCADRRHELLRTNEAVDVVSLGIITAEEAQVRLDLYRNHLYAAHPLVEISADVTVAQLMAEQPFLFNTIMSIASMVSQHNFDRDTNLRLENHAVDKIVTEVMVAGTKTVEMLRSLILLLLWYNSPEFFKLRRYHILNCVAVTLLHDMGIVSRTTYAYSSDDQQLHKSCDDFLSLEYRLLILILYFSTVSICLILRRAIFVKWTPYVNECCTLLENTTNPKYRQLAMFLRLNHELERIHHIVHAPEAYESPNRLPRYSLAEFQTNLSIIKNSLAPDDHLHRAYYYLVEAYLHQPTLTDMHGSSPPESTHKLDSDTLGAIAHCTASCLFAMDEFNQLLPGEIAGLPLFYCLRVIYTAGMLLRLRYLILSLPSHVEKELVPRYAIVVILKLNKHVAVASRNFPGNNFLKKMRLILVLFIQTYVTQVMELLKKNDGDLPASLRRQSLTRSSRRDLVLVANSLRKHADSGNLITEDGKVPGPPLHLDLLSFAAAAFHKTGDDTDKELKIESPEFTPLHTVTPLDVPRRTLNVRQSVAAAPAPINPITQKVPTLKASVFPTPPVYNHFNPRGSVGMDLGHEALPEIEASKDNTFFSIDDEFWSNLLSTDANKFHFAQSEPVPNENVLFMN